MWGWVIGGLLILGVVALAVSMAPKKCPRCRVPMRLLTSGCGKTKKYECPRCGHRIDTGVPIGRGRR